LWEFAATEGCNKRQETVGAFSNGILKVWSEKESKEAIHNSEGDASATMNASTSIAQRTAKKEKVGKSN